MSFKNPSSQCKKNIFNVYTFINKLSEKNDLTPDLFKSTQKVTSDACRVPYLTLNINVQKHVRCGTEWLWC